MKKLDFQSEANRDFSTLAAKSNTDRVIEPIPFLAASQPLRSVRIVELRFVLTAACGVVGIHSANTAITTTERIRA